MPQYPRRNGTTIWARDKAQARRWLLPYGCYHCAWGRKVLFDRDYNPIIERHGSKPPTMADPAEWIENIERHEWFYNDGTPEAAKLRAAKTALEQWGVLDEVLAAVDAFLGRGIPSR